MRVEKAVVLEKKTQKLLPLNAQAISEQANRRKGWKAAQSHYYLGSMYTYIHQPASERSHVPHLIPSLSGEILKLIRLWNWGGRSCALAGFRSSRSQAIQSGANQLGQNRQTDRQTTDQPRPKTLNLDFDWLARLETFCNLSIGYQKPRSPILEPNV